MIDDIDLTNIQLLGTVFNTSLMNHITSTSTYDNHTTIAVSYDEANFWMTPTIIAIGSSFVLCACLYFTCHYYRNNQAINPHATTNLIDTKFSVNV